MICLRILELPGYEATYLPMLLPQRRKKKKRKKKIANITGSSPFSGVT